MIALLLGLLLGIVHYFSDHIHIRYHIHKMKAISLSAGIFVAYVFLHLFPFIYMGEIQKMTMLFMLIGFTVFHVLEKYIYKHAGGPALKREMKEIHAVAFFLYHLTLGIVLVGLIASNLFNGLLFFFPLVFFTAVHSLSAKELYAIRRVSVKALISLSTLIGTLIAFFFTIPTLISSLLFGFVVGSLVYVIIMDSIPKEREGEPAFFVAGVFIYALIIFLTWMF
jgi:hypothetical protein